MLFKQLLSSLEAMPPLIAEMDTQTELHGPWDGGICHILSLCFHRNPDPYKPKHGSERLEPADRVSRSSPPSPGCEFGYPQGSSLPCANTLHLGTRCRCANTPRCGGWGSGWCPPTAPEPRVALTAVTRFLFYFSCGIAVLNKVSKTQIITTLEVLQMKSVNQFLNFLTRTLTDAKFL